MANEFIIKNGFFSQGNSVVTGSLIVTAGITGSLQGSASYALTASYALGGGSAAFPYTGSALITGSLGITGSLSNGTEIIASGPFSHAEGDRAEANNSFSHAEGARTIASGTGSHAEGASTQATGNYSHAEGSDTIASGSYSHAEGSTTIASGSHSHAEGSTTQANGNYSHAEGNATEAIGDYSHAEGSYTMALGQGAHAEGEYTIAYGYASHAEGLGTVASGSFQHVSGQYNTHGDNSSLFIIGNGVSGSRSDVLKVSGSTVVAGFNPTPLTGSIRDGITSVLGDLQDWNSQYYSGEVLYSEVSKEALNFGQLCWRDRYGQWGKAIGDVIGEPAKNMLGICLHTVGAADEATSILTRGYVETTYYVSSAKSGDPVFMDATTAGSITPSPPAAAGNIVRIVGNIFWATGAHANGKWIMYFNPDNTWIEL
jgi:hypothetical protein